VAAAFVHPLLAQWAPKSVVSQKGVVTEADFFGAFQTSSHAKTSIFKSIFLNTH
jgi:hypothetical protein